MQTALPTKPVYYPDSDGKPMAESDLHRDEMFREINLLQRYFEGQDVYVSGNLLVYFVEGDPKQCFSPDVLVAKGLKQRDRRTYRIWHEGVVPQTVIEVTSNKTKKKDQKDKPLLYARLGIREYFMFDPTQDYLTPALRGFRLEDGEYVPMIPDSDGSLESQELNLRLCPDGEQLAFFRLDNGERLLCSEEARAIERAARAAAEQNLEAEREARLQEREARLRERDARLKEQEAHLQERAARIAAEEELARLRKELERRSSSD